MIRRVYKQFLEKEIKSSRVPVILEPMSFYINKICKEEHRPDYQACFVHGQFNDTSLPTNFIFIDKTSKSNYKILSNYYHEKGHADCFLNKCECFSVGDQPVLKEIHAFEYELRMSLEKEILPSLVYSVRSIVNFANMRPVTDDHRAACWNVMDGELWSDCINFLAETMGVACFWIGDSHPRKNFFNLYSYIGNFILKESIDEECRS